jgi:hypothetical protein
MGYEFFPIKVSFHAWQVMLFPSQFMLFCLSCGVMFYWYYYVCLGYDVLIHGYYYDGWLHHNQDIHNSIRGSIHHTQDRHNNIHGTLRHMTDRTTWTEMERALPVKHEMKLWSERTTAMKHLYIFKIICLILVT